MTCDLRFVAREHRLSSIGQSRTPPIPPILLYNPLTLKSQSVSKSVSSRRRTTSIPVPLPHPSYPRTQTRPYRGSYSCSNSDSGSGSCFCCPACNRPSKTTTKTKDERATVRENHSTTSAMTVGIVVCAETTASGVNTVNCHLGSYVFQREGRHKIIQSIPAPPCWCFPCSTHLYQDYHRVRRKRRTRYGIEPQTVQGEEIPSHHLL